MPHPEREMQIEVARLRRHNEELQRELAVWRDEDGREAKYEHVSQRCTKAESERDALRAALEKLIKRLDFVHADGMYQSVWTLHQIHMGPYHGPRYVNELDAARAALAAEPSEPAAPAPDLRAAWTAMKMVDDAYWGDFCCCCGVILSLESQDEECGPQHTAVHLVHEWLEKHPEQPPGAAGEGTT